MDVSAQNEVAEQGRQYHASAVAHEKQAAAFAFINVAQQIIEQHTRPEIAGRSRTAANHGCLVNDKKGMLQFVETQRETCAFALKCLLTIDGLMDGVSPLSGVG